MNGRITLIREDGTEFDITGHVQLVYDTAVGSMDYGSGMLATEEVVSLKLLAAVCGFDQVDYHTDVCTACGHQYQRHVGSGACFAAPDGGYRQHGDDSRCECLGWARPDVLS